MIFPIRVYIEDTDMMGVVYHSNYLNFFERARTEWLHANGLTLTNMSKDDTYFAVRRLNIDFKSPARLEDDLTVETTVKKTGFCQASFIQKLYNSAQQLLVEATVDVVCVTSKMTPRRLPSRVFEEYIE